MLTLFTTAKPFTGLDGNRQYNAIGSWKRLHPDVDVILCGEGKGYGEAARELGLTHVPEVETSEEGVPRVDSMFRLATARARHDVLAYVNADIILLDDFLSAVRSIDLDRFLMVGRRWNFDVTEQLGFEDGWAGRLRALAKEQGKLFTPWGIDYFVFKGDVWGELPPMVVGRAGYDNWLIYRAMSRGVPVVDATGVTTVVHQNHDYSHVEGGRETVFEGGQDVRKNMELAGKPKHLFTMSDADWRLTKDGLRRNWCSFDSQRCAEVQCIINGRTLPPSRMAEICLELKIRLARVKEKGSGPILKFPAWAVLRLLGRR